MKADKLAEKLYRFLTNINKKAQDVFLRLRMSHGKKTTILSLDEPKRDILPFLNTDMFRCSKVSTTKSLFQMVQVNAKGAILFVCLSLQMVENSFEPVLCTFAGWNCLPMWHDGDLRSVRQQMEDVWKCSFYLFIENSSNLVAFGVASSSPYPFCQRKPSLTDFSSPESRQKGE